jgi:hypothetical protein
MTYYNINDGETVSHSHTAWDIAFNVGQQGSSIFVNEAVASAMGPPLPAVELYLTNSIDFETADTADMTRIYNNEISWAEGAFNHVKDDADPFDLGWGSYNPSNNSVTGTRIFAVKLRNGSIKKLEIELLSDGIYTFQYANLDGNNEESISIDKSDYTDKTLAYFSMENSEALDLEPENWDLVFTRYVTPLPDGTGGILDYTLTGVLHNSGVEVAQADGVDPEDVDSEDYEDSYTTQLDEIGFDWKDFDLGTFQWAIVADRVYFVKTVNDELWKLWFFDFEGSSTGVSSIQKTFVSDLVNVEDEFENLQSFNIFPNPATDLVNVAFELETTDKTGILSLTNQLGQTVLQKTTAIQNGLNIQQIPFNLPAGVYHLSLQIQNEVITRPLIIR